MPRAKVKPEDRQRSVIACVPCKQSKIRCDAGHPCSTCVKRGRQQSCVYPSSSSSTSPAAVRARRLSRLSNKDHGTQPSVNESHQQTYDENTSSHVEGTESTEVNSDDDGVFTDPETGGPKSRMLLTSRFEKVYVGETASLSYLQFLRQIVKLRIGPCSFTEGEFNNYMLELESDDLSGSNDPITSLELSIKQEFAQSYLEGTSGVLDLFSRDEMLASLSNPQAVDSPLDMATTYLVLAVGAQCRGLGPSDLYYSNAFFSHAQKLAFETMLHDPSPRMVRQFLLMAFYMLGACHRNAAFMYLGVASRAASTLGMHRTEHYLELEQDEAHSRIKIWKSLRGLDMIVNSILGRTGSLTALHDPRMAKIVQEFGTDGSSRESALQAIFALCPYMDELERKECKRDTKSAEDFLHRLQDWSKALPPGLRRSTDSSEMAAVPGDKEPFIAATHVGCAYYFTVILTTRRFLTVHLLPRTRDPTASHEAVSDAQKRHVSLAHVCLNAAVNLAKVGHNALKSERMPNNMCLMKAWMLAAGLLLGYWLFANGSDNEVEEAFHQARAVEKKLSLLSPQAGHYYDILTSFSDAITAHHRRLADERKRATSKYVDQIFTAGGDNIGSSMAPITPDLSIPSQDTALPDFQNNIDQDALLGVAQTDAAALGLPEGFPWSFNDVSFDWEPFTPFSNDLLFP